MQTLRMFESEPESIPTSTVWHLAELAEARGRQELYTRQSPQKLRILREHALIESTVSSNRIEGVEIEGKRVGTVVFGNSLLRDRNEEEVRGYRLALDWVHRGGSKLGVTEKTIRKLHHLSRAGVGDAGEYKARDGDIIEVLPSGRRVVRFVTVSAKKTPKAMAETVERLDQALHARTVPALVAHAAFNLDFLCVHPFRDGNGRASRLLLLLSAYHCGHEVGRFISLERLIEKNKERYYETLKLSSEGWHESRHDPWPYINFTLYMLQEASKEFERRVGDVRLPRGEKRNLVIEAIDKLPVEFRVEDLRKGCPEVGIDMIRKVLNERRLLGAVECVGRGAHATWKKRF